MCVFVVLANRLTVAVSDVLNPNIDDMSRGVGPLGYGTSQGDLSPQVSLHLRVILPVKLLFRFLAKEMATEMS